MTDTLRWRKFLLLIATGLAIGLASVRFLYLLVEYAAQWSITDFAVYYYAAQNWRMGLSLYTGQPAHPAMPENYLYAYPPTLAMLLIPLTLLSYETAWWLWSLAAIAGAVGMIWLLITALKFRGAWRWILFAGTLWFPPLHYSVMFQNVQIWVFILLMLAWLTSRRAGNLPAFLSGLLIGFLAGLKLYPILMLIPLLSRRRWWAIPGAILGLCPAALALCLTIQELPACLDVMSKLSTRWTTSLINLSLWGQARFRLGPETGSWVAPPLIAAVLVLALWLSWSHKDQFDAMWGLWIMVMLLVSPVARVQYLLLTLLPMLIVFRRVLTTRPYPHRLGRTWLLTLILLCSPPLVWVEEWPPLVNVLLSSGPACGVVLCAGLIAYTLGSRPQTTQAIARSSPPSR